MNTKAILLLLVALIVLATQSQAMQRSECLAQEIRTISLDNLEQFSVKTDRGNITVCGIPKLNKIIIDVIKQADKPYLMRHLHDYVGTFKNSRGNNNVIIYGDIDEPIGENAKASINFFIRFPRHIPIEKTFITALGTIVLRNLKGKTFAEAPNGLVEATNVAFFTYKAPRCSVEHK